METIDVKAISENIKAIISELDSLLHTKDEIREQLIRITRDIIRLSGDVVTYIHLREEDKARDTLERVKSLVKQALEISKDHPELRYSGLMNNALAEYVEAHLLYSLIYEHKLLSYRDLDVHYVPYILGLCDLVGELKRVAIEALRSNDIRTSFTMLEIMEMIYSELRKLDYPDALAPGLRHKVDIMRRVTEDLKVFLIDIDRRNKLIEKIERLEKSLRATV